MIAFILKVTLCWLFFYGIYELFLKKRTFFNANRSYLLLTLFAGILLPLLEFIPWKNESNVAHVIYPVLVEIDDLQRVVSSNESERFTWLSALYLLYAFGVITGFVRFLLGLRRIYDMYRRGDKIHQNGFTIVKTDQVHLPFSFFNSVFLSSKMPLSKEVDRILDHEVEHIKGRHSWDILITEMAKIIFWCSPMIYLYKNALKEVHEFLADQVVVSKSDKVSYKKLLLAQTNSGLQMALTHQFFNSHLKNRIKMINQKRSGRPTLVMYALGIPVLLLLLATFTYNLGEEKLVTNSDKIYQVGFGEDKMFQFLEYADITNQDLIPYIEINGEPIDLPLSDHIDLEADMASFCKYDPKSAMEMFGEKAKNGYINFTNPKRKIAKESSAKEFQSVKDKIFSRFKAKADTIPPSLKGQADLPVEKEEIYKVVEQMPRFPGCEEMEGDHKQKEQCAKQRMLEYIYGNLKYPKEDRDNGVQGMAVVQFVVRSDGSVSGAKVLRSLSEGTDREVLKMVESMNYMEQKWTPGSQRGKQVNVQYTLPVRFKISDEEVNEEVKSADPSEGNEETAKTEQKSTIVLNSEVGDGKPLFVVDGKVLPMSEKNNLDPDEIKEINVLKGEKATEKYGDKGLHGVVEIITKNSKKDKIVKNDFDTPAYFPGCSEIKDLEAKDKCSKQNLLNYIYSNLKYPKEAASAGIEGMIVSRFIIGADGKINDIKLVRDKKGLSDSALKVVSEMADTKVWEPAMKDGKAVAMEFHLPIKFKLEDQEVKKVETKYNSCEDITDEAEKQKCKAYNKAIVKEALEHLEADDRQLEDLKLIEVLVSPNPAKRESVNLRFRGDQKPTSVQVFSLEGKLLYNRSIPTFSGSFDDNIDLTNTDTNLIILRIVQEGKAYTEKIVIE